MAAARAVAKKNTDWDAVAAMYADRALTLVEIARRAGISVSAIKRKARAESWPPRRTLKGAVRPPDGFVALVWRLYRALDRQMREVERRLEERDGEGDSDAAARERDARTLAALTRTLEKLRELETRAAAAPDAAAPEGEQTTDDLRAELRRRLDQLLAAHGKSGVS